MTPSAATPDDSTPSHDAIHPHEVYELVGGMPAFEQLVEAFYARVETDAPLRAHYPEDLEPGKRHLALFLAQYWGGGDVYNTERGHPRLRMRHAPFEVTPDAADRWAVNMLAALHEQDWPEAATVLMVDYVMRATPSLINTLPEAVVPPSGRTLPEI